ncbi:MAG: MFS transporter [Endomicrobium sp.]|jgi:sugar phosphate permease|nr:MFS transporter [Endomicrobium sp.]
MLSKFVNWIKPVPDAKIMLTNKQEIAKKYKIWRIRMFFGMYAGYLMYYLNRKNLSYVAPLFINEFKLTKMNFGVLSSTMAITYGIGKFISGVIADRCNIKTFMAFGLIGSSVINLFFGFLPSLPLLIFFWGVNGGFQSMGFPPVTKGLVYWFSQNERGTVWTLFTSSKMGGIALVGILGSFFIAIKHWQAIFYIPGIIGIIISVNMLFILTDKPSSIGLPPIEIFRKDLTPLKKHSELSHWKILNKYVFCNKYIWFLSIGSTFMYFIRFTALDWSTIFMTERGISPKIASSLLVFMPLVGILGGVSSGWLCDNFFKSRCVPVSLIYLFFLTVSLLGMYYFIDAETPLWIIGLLLSLVGFFVDGPQSIAFGVLLTRLTLQESAAAAIGFNGMFQYLGTFLAGIGAAIIIEKYGWYSIFMLCGILCLAVMLLVSLTWNEEIRNCSDVKTQ